jgi:hypothetical protein
MKAVMRKLVLKMSISLDGFVGGPNGEIDRIFRTIVGDCTEWVVDICLTAKLVRLDSKACSFKCLGLLETIEWE